MCRRQEAHRSRFQEVIFSAISRYLKATTVVQIEFCYRQACLKNKVGYETVKVFVF